MSQTKAVESLVSKPASLLQPLSWLQRIVVGFFDNCGDKIKILLSFAQVVVLIPSVYQLAWPISFVQFTGLFSVMGFNYFSSIPIDCIFQRSYYNALLVQCIFPAVFIAAVWTVLGPVAYRAHRLGDADTRRSALDWAVKGAIYVLFLVVRCSSAHVKRLFRCIPGSR